MEAQDPLSELADIHLPDAIDAWPPAIGWWILAALLLAAVIYAAYALFIRIVRHKRLSFARKELDCAYQAFSEQVIFDATRNQSGLTYLNEVNAILKRVALLWFPSNSEIASLNGKPWLAFLDDSDHSIEFSTGAGKALGEGIYQRTFDADGDALYELAQRWIENRYKEQTAGAITSPSKPTKSGVLT